MNPDRSPRLFIHEAVLLALGVGTGLGLLATSGFGSPVTLEVFTATGLLLAATRLREGLRIKVRLAAAFLFALWFYSAVIRIVPALGLPLRDAELLAADRWLFGETPAIRWQHLVVPLATEIMSACYLSYHVYLALCLLHAIGKPAAFAIRYYEYPCTAFGIGLTGYLLFPAIGPYMAYPEDFTVSLTGGWLTHLNQFLVSNGSSRYDAFPSLHITVTLANLHHDWRFVRTRFWTMLAPAIGLAFSTVYLRYHYVTDLLAGTLLFAALAIVFERRWRKRELASRAA